jgi:hypothetical protein
MLTYVSPIFGRGVEEGPLGAGSNLLEGELGVKVKLSNSAVGVNG